METILVTILPRLGLSVVGGFNNFLKFCQFSQSVLERLASVCHLHCTVSRRWRKRENSLETWTRSLRETRQIQSNLATFQHHQSNNHPPENDVVEGLNSEKENIFYFFFFW